jgi:hypothetical protein
VSPEEQDGVILYKKLAVHFEAMITIALVARYATKSSDTT